MAVHHEGETVGTVTSVLSPTLGHPIAMAYVPASLATAGTGLSVDLGAGRPPRSSIYPSTDAPDGPVRRPYTPIERIKTSPRSDDRGDGTCV